MDEKDFDKLIEDVYSGLIYKEFLPLNLYLYTANYLLGAVYQGFGYNLTEVANRIINAEPITLIEKQASANLLRNLATNIYQFSAAKTFQNVYDLQSVMFKDGFKVGFNEFKKDANKILDDYNKNWLKTEYRTATISAAGAAAWDDVQRNKNEFPLLKYQTANDGNVRVEHVRLDNIVKPVNDPFWNNFYPPNGWNCRCIVISLGPNEEPVTKLTPTQLKEIKKEVPPVFMNNPGKTGSIFSDHHPYFDVPERYAELKKNNFNLPLPNLPLPKEVVKTGVKEVVNPTKVIEKTIEQRIEEVKIKAKVLDAEFKEVRGVINTKLEAVRTEVVALVKDLKNTNVALIRTTEAAEEYNLKYKKYQTLHKEFKAVLKEKAIIDNNYSIKAAEILKSKNAPANVEVISIKTGLADTHKHRSQAFEMFKNIVGDKVRNLELIDGQIVKNNKLKFKTKIIQGRAQHRRGVLEVMANEEFKVICHEMGHGLELYDTSHWAEVQKFYEARTKGAPVKRLMDKYPQYTDPKEVYKEDKFTDEYTGKWYVDSYSGKQRASEITPMWFSHALDDLNEFIEKDPEYFEFIYKLFNL